MPLPVFDDTFSVGSPGLTRLMLASAAALIELDGFGQIHLREDGYIGGIEDRRILERLVLAFGHRKQDHSQILAEIVGRRAHQIADVFDEQKIQRHRDPNLPSASRTMAASRWHSVPVVICFTGAPRTRQPRGVVFGGQIADQRGDAVSRAAAERSVFSRNAVFPEPGLDTRLTTKTPASWKRCRSSRATMSFCLRTFLSYFHQPGLGSHSCNLQRDDFQFPPLKHFRHGTFAFADKRTTAWNPVCAATDTRAISRSRELLRSPGASPASPYLRRPARRTRAAHPSPRRPAPEFQMHRVYARAASALGFFLSHFDDAHRDG